MSLSHQTTGTTGAATQSWRATNPRSLLDQIAKKYPRADKAEITRRFDKAVRDVVGIPQLGNEEEDILFAINEYWVTNNFSSLRRQEEKSSRRPTDHSAQRKATEAVKEAVKERIVEEAKMLLLDWVMPNNKQLRACSGREVAQLWPRVGKWLAAIAKKVKPNELVGDVFTETQVRCLYDGKVKIITKS